MSHDPTEEHPDPDGGEMLARLSDEMVRAQKKFFGKGPTMAKSYMVDDLLFIVMRGGLTTAEQTMVDFSHHDLVREFRQTFENEMTERLTGMVERVTNRKVLTYQSQVLFDPHVIIEMFVFDQPSSKHARMATAGGQIEDDSTGEATDEQALDTPSIEGQ